MLKKYKAKVLVESLKNFINTYGKSKYIRCGADMQHIKGVYNPCFIGVTLESNVYSYVKLPNLISILILLDVNLECLNHCFCNSYLVFTLIQLDIILYLSTNSVGKKPSNIVSILILLDNN